jgi:hypothetical protein|nr:MAG TPA_asm: hypothetical protein [Caudoviricetes sp.]
MRVRFKVFIEALEKQGLTLMEFCNKSQTIPWALVMYLSGEPITFDKKTICLGFCVGC